MNLRGFLSISALSMMVALTPATGARAFDDMQKKDIETIVRDYLLANPEILIEMQQTFEEKREASRRDKAVGAIEENKAALFSSSHDIALGNPNGKVTVVEFFDYNCTYCKSAIADMDAIIQSNPEIRFVLKEFPILGEDSVAAHRVSDAFRKIAPEKYGDFHRTLLGSRDHADEAAALAVAASLGVTEDQIRAKMAETGNEAGVRETYGIAEALGVTGTPSYVVGSEAIFGAIGAEAIKAKVANVQSCGKTIC